MFKKLVSMITAVFLMTTGFSVIGTSSAQAAICNAGELLQSSSTIKGVTFTKGTRLANSYDFNGGGSTSMGSVTLTAAEASGTGITSITATAGGTATWLYVSPSINSWGNNDISTTDNHQNVTLINRRIFEIKISGSGCTDYYRLNIIVTGTSSSSSSGSTNTSAAGFAESLATQHKQLIRVQAARTTLFTALSATKPGTLIQYSDAELTIKSEAALSRVNARVLTLPTAQRSNSDEIAKIVKLENFVDSVSNSDIHPASISVQLVSNGFITADNRFKYSLANALRSRPASSVDSVEEIKAAIVQETARLQERMNRTAEIRAKIQSRKI
jgi:hypothetical protein